MSVVIEPSELVVAAVLAIVVEDDELAEEALLLLLLLSLLLLVFSVEADCCVAGTALPMELIDMSLAPFRVATYLENDGIQIPLRHRRNKYKQHSCLI